ncbi:cutinase family protein [Nocardia sp. NPDC127526]|uniref:cutinase family protein n=1 Tax=Nocardia sp. NPDC127526 TaxID=3345393 RepID=UPI0036440A8D
MSTVRTASFSFAPARLLGAAAAAMLIAVGGGLAVGGAPTAHAYGCAEVDVVVARGTEEPGLLGAAVGDPLVGALRDTLPMSVSAYRVNYPADLLNPDSIGNGSRDLVDHIVGVSIACPATRFVVVGYSQGAVVVHTAAGTDITAAIPGATQLPTDITSRIAAVLLFGDPLRLLGGEQLPEPYRDRLGSWCTAGDPVCEPGGFLPTAHVAYTVHLSEAALFAAAHL